MIKAIIILLFPTFAFATSLQLAPIPIFLKAGFSSVLDFNKSPTKVVLGDAQKFQVQKLDHSLVIKPRVPYATTNMFVYFKSDDPKIFILTASEDDQPTFYKKFEAPAPLVKKIIPVRSPRAFLFHRGGRVLLAHFSPKKDYLTVNFIVSAGSRQLLKPVWSWVRIVYKTKAIAPFKIWAQRQVVQKDTRVRARAIFVKPNIPRNLKNVTLVVPIEGNLTPISLPLRGRL